MTGRVFLMSEVPLYGVFLMSEVPLYDRTSAGNYDRGSRSRTPTRKLASASWYPPETRSPKP